MVVDVHIVNMHFIRMFALRLLMKTIIKISHSSFFDGDLKRTFGYK
jgi:hypothetical protein